MMYAKLLAAYAVVFALVLGYLFYIQRRLGRLEDRVTSLNR